MAGAVEARFGERASAVATDASGAGRAGRQGRLAGLDLLRLVAAFAVVAFHFGYAGSTRGVMQTAYPELAGLAKYGFVGVDLFFVISGLVIAASALGRTWSQFALSRLLRLYPAHVACMTATAVVLGMLDSGATWGRWFANLTMLAPAFGQPFMDGAYWSIVLEIVFYVWVAALAAVGIFERRLLTILAVWLALALLNEAVLQWRPLRLALVTEYAGMFASGILIHRIRTGERSLLAFALLGFAVGLGALHTFGVQREFARLYADTLDIGVLWLLHAGIYALLAAALWLSRWLSATPLLLTLGGLTYPLYLVHQNAGYLIIDHIAPGLGRWPALAIVVMAMLATAWIAYRLIEPAGRRLLARAIELAMLHAARAITAAYRSMRFSAWRPERVRRGAA